MEARPQHIGYLGEALNYFFNNAVMNLYDEDIAINLMDLFPLLKQRRALRYTVYLMLVNYVFTNGLVNSANLQYVLPDTLFDTSFNGTIPALLYYYQDPDSHIITAIPMQEAIERGLTHNHSNTYQAIQVVHPTFNPQNFNIILLRDIVNLDIIFLDLGQNIIDMSLYERDLANEIVDIYKELRAPIVAKREEQRRLGIQVDSGNLGPVDVYRFIKVGLDINCQNIVTALINHPSVNRLYSSIVLQDTPAVTANLQIIDPRSDNNKAYHLAVETGNRIIIEMVKDNIIQRNLLQQQALTQTITHATGYETDIPQNVYQYMQRNIQPRI